MAYMECLGILLTNVTYTSRVGLRDPSSVHPKSELPLKTTGEIAAKTWLGCTRPK